MSGATGRTHRALEPADRILLAGMVLDGRHGVGEEERAAPQPFGVDVALELDLSPAGTSDDLTRTVDYSLVHADIRAIVEGPAVLLLETLAERIAGRILDAYPAVDAATVRVRKLRPPLPGEIESSGVELRRARRPEAVPASIADTLLALEQAIARRDEAAIPGGYEAVLDDDFAEHGSSGRDWTRAEILAALRDAPTGTDIDIADFGTEAVAPGVVLARFITEGRSPVDGAAIRSRRSSVWVHDGDRWRLRFHQGTPLP